MQYAEIFSQFPPELRESVARLIDALREDFGVRRSDFDELKTAVRELVQAQKELTEAQKRTENRIQELTEAQKRTENQIQELANRTENQIQELANRTDRQIQELANRIDRQIQELAYAQKRTEDEMTLFRRTFTSQIGGLGARWGLQSESAFREGMEAVLQEVGFTAERFLEYDTQGEVFGDPDQIELDVVVKNGRVIVIEIKSSLNKSDVYYFVRKVAFYARKTGRQVARKLMVTPYADPRALEASMRLGVEICTDINSLPPP
jgi:hypothetical protein